MQIVNDPQTGQILAKINFSPDAFELLCKICDIYHPNLMRIYSVSRYTDRCECICEYINGVTLEQMLAHEGLCNERSAKEIMMQVCDGLAALHAKGIIHRDIKPSNVMIDASGRVKIVDFDISRTTKPNQNKDTRILGTAGYTSPEQFGFDQTDAKADIYSCGVLLNFLLTGQRPDEKMYEGSLREVIETCIQIDKSKRFDNVAALRKAIKYGHSSKASRFFPLPGFRGEKAFSKIIMTLLIISAVFLAVSSFNLWVIDPYGTFANGAGIMRWLGMNIFIFLLPYLFFGDFAYMSDLICPKKPRAGKSILRILAIISIGVGFYLMLQSARIYY